MDTYTGELHGNQQIDQLLSPMLPELLDFRRDLHRHPELSFQEYRTTKKIAERLQAAGLRPWLLDGTGVVVDIGRGPITAALRGDIDALPIREETGLAWASTNHGVMHACGHDFHTSIALGVALVLHRLDQHSPLPFTIRIVFQPAEEKLPGGAQACIAQGVLEAVPRILSVHCEPTIDVGHIGTRIGAITSASDTLKIELTGRGGHTSRPHLTEDMVFALAQIAINVPAVLSRRVDVRSGVAVVWGQITAGEAPNAIANKGYLSGTMRCLDRDAWYEAGALLDEVVAEVAAPYGVDVTLNHIRGVPPVVNSEYEIGLIESAAREILGDDSVELVAQSMGGEDFAWFLKEVPGAMMRLGTRSPGGETYDLHRGDLVIHEDALGYGIRVLTSALLRARH